MRITILMILCCISCSVLAQDSNKGIQWAEGLSWAGIKQKAKAEGKYIFVDAYTTWCGYCKKMDREVYPDEQVGKAANEKFISVRVQMDSSARDNAAVKEWYRDAAAMQQAYKVFSFPTYLFFSPSGELVHYGAGYKDSFKFLTLLKQAADPARQTYAQLKRYEAGERDYTSMAALAINLRESGETEKAYQIATVFKKEYLDRLPEDQLFTKENVEFVTNFAKLLHSSDPFFKFFLAHKDSVDAMTNKGKAELYTEWVICCEDLYPVLYSKDGRILVQEPDWKKLEANIESKYGAEIAHNIMKKEQPDFYMRAGNWAKWAGFAQAKLDRMPEGSEKGFQLNEVAWTIFGGCNDKAVLKKALGWSERSIELLKAEKEPNTQVLDTRANLLYKLGRTREAIAQEQKALRIENELAAAKGQAKGPSADQFSTNLAKMKAGKPTWQVPEKK